MAHSCCTAPCNRLAQGAWGKNKNVFLQSLISTKESSIYSGFRNNVSDHQRGTPGHSTNLQQFSKDGLIEMILVFDFQILYFYARLDISICISAQTKI